MNACPNLSDQPVIRTILLVGNPNCGKTTIFNYLTGNRHKVANYPGVTVEKRSGALLSETKTNVEVVDLPGIYSLSGQSADERIAEQELRKAAGHDTLIISVLDASNLDRNMYLLSELMDIDARLIVVLNMIDLAEKDGIHIREELLSQKLGVPVLKLSGRKKTLLQPLTHMLSECLRCVGSNRCHPKQRAWVSEDNKEIVELLDQTSPNFSFQESGKIAQARYQWIKKIISDCVTRSKANNSKSEKLDRFILHPFYGTLIFLVSMAVLFQAVFSWASLPMDLIDQLVITLGNSVIEVMPSGVLRSLIVDGIISGVGAVLVFVPQIAILFFLIGLLEESGYLCRAAVLMDRFMRPFGLQGRSFIPLLSSFACAVPGIMSTRTIPSHTDRLITIMVAPLMSCSARLPVYTILISAFIPSIKLFGFISVQGLVLFALYALGIIGAVFVAWLVKILFLKGQPSMFLMELPRYRMPAIKNILLEVWDRVKLFVQNAGTVILACSIILWFLASYPSAPEGMNQVEHSFAGRIGKTIEPIIEPLGYNWEIGVSLLASFAAREVFISSLATVYNLGDDDQSIHSLSNVLAERQIAGTGFGLASALSLLVFYVFACQCMSTLAVCKRETGSWNWVFIMFIYMTAMAYVLAWATYNVTIALS